MSPQIRQTLGCGYEPPIDDRRKLTMWRPPAAFKGEVTMCAGYTTSLPEVREVALMYRHWLMGNLAPALGRLAATEDLLSLIVVMDSEANALEHWRMTKAAE